MKRVREAPDMTGRLIRKGDTVSAVNGSDSGRVWDLKDDDGIVFVCIRPVHQPYANPVWYASDQLLWVATPAAAAAKQQAAAEKLDSGGEDVEKDADADATRPLQGKS